MPDLLRGIAHVDQDLVTVLTQLPLVQITLDLGKLGEGCIDDMFADELGFVLVEAVGDEDRYVVHPGVTRGCAEQDPLIRLGDLEKGLDPLTTADKALLIE